MKITVKAKFPYTFEMTDESQTDSFNKLSKKELLEVEIKGIRDPRTHRKYFAMLNKAFENQERYINFDHFREELQVKAGYAEPFIVDGEHVADRPKSIEFRKLRQEDFRVLCDKVRGVIMKEFDFGIEFDNELANFNY